MVATSHSWCIQQPTTVTMGGFTPIEVDVTILESLYPNQKSNNDNKQFLFVFSSFMKNNLNFHRSQDAT